MKEDSLTQPFHLTLVEYLPGVMNQLSTVKGVDRPPLLCRQESLST